MTKPALLVVLVLVSCGDDATPDDSGPVEDASTDDGATDAGPDAPSACTEECTGLTPVCDEENMTCVQCVVPGDCASLGPRTMCADNVCVECTDNSQCMTAEAPVCATDGDMAGLCVACTGMTGDCDGIMDGGTALAVCDTSGDAGVCVECFAGDESACGAKVCDVQARTCSNEDEDSLAPCGLCISDRQCTGEQVCAQETFDGEPTEFRCAWPKAATGVGAPNGACADFIPYVENNDDEPVMTVGGDMVVVCQLRTTTCAAFGDYGTVDCGELGAAGDAMCGLDGVDDGLCRNSEGAINECTYICRNDDDCRGGAVCTGDVPSFCDF